MNVKEKIEKMEDCRGKNHDLRLFRSWLNEYLPVHRNLSKSQVGGTNRKGSTCQWLASLLENAGYILREYYRISTVPAGCWFGAHDSN